MFSANVGLALALKKTDNICQHFARLSDEKFYNFDSRKYFWESLVPNSKGGDYGAVCIDLKDAVSLETSLRHST